MAAHTQAQGPGGVEDAARVRSELVAIVLELARIVAARRQARAEDDDEGSADPAVVFARDPAALAELQARLPLPPVYAEFLRGHSSHDFVDGGLTCAGEAAWIAAVDTVAELTRCCVKGGAERVVCGVSGRGHYVLDLARARGGDCPVLHVPDRGSAREVAGSFVGFLRRVARESDSGHAPKNMSKGESEIAEEGTRTRATGWLAVAALAVAGLLAYVAVMLAG